ASSCVAVMFHECDLPYEREDNQSASIVIVHGTQVVLVNCGADCSTHLFSCHLIGSKMYPAVNTCIGDILGNLPERCVIHDDVGDGRIRQCDRMSSFPVKTSHDLGCGVTCTAVS